MAEISTYEVRWKLNPECVWYVSAEKPGAACYEAFLRLRDVVESPRFQDLTVRRIANDAAPCPYRYVRQTYGVPAYVGGKVTYNGQPFEIVRPPECSSAYVWLLRNGHAVPIHPKETGLVYLETRKPQEAPNA